MDEKKDMKEMKEVVAFEKQLGSFVLRFVRIGDELVARISSAAGNWKVEWDGDNEMYPFLRSFASSDEFDEYLGALCVLFYTATNMKFVDIDFLNSFADIVNELNERNMKLHPADEKKDAEDLKAVQTRDEMSKDEAVQEYMKNLEQEAEKSE